MKTTKKLRAFRLSPEVIELVAEASAETGVSQGDIIEGCVREKINEVVGGIQSEAEKQRAQKEALRNGVGALSATAQKRARAPRSDKGQKRGSKLTNRQKN